MKDYELKLLFIMNDKLESTGNAFFFPLTAAALGYVR